MGVKIVVWLVARLNDAAFDGLRENTAVPNPLGWNVKFSAADLYRHFHLSVFQPYPLQFN